jgi:glycosyltransferase involved in cell wall biosynthesis
VTPLRFSREHALWNRPSRRSSRRPGEPAAVLFVGQSYYHGWYLTRELRRLGWKADQLDFDQSPSGTELYHGHDFALPRGGTEVLHAHLDFLEYALDTYDVFHFSNAHALAFGHQLQARFAELYHPGADIELLKAHGKKIVYANNGCLDGVAQSSFASWDPVAACSVCPFRDVPTICSDERNLAWGAFRNRVADLQVTTGGNRADYNNDARVHEVPEFYCVDPDLWNPDLVVPTNYRVPIADSTVKLYHSIGNLEVRRGEGGRNMKGTHVFVPLAERLKREGRDVELMFFHDVPSTKIRYYQAQADIVLDQLTIGWFGANGRESLMLGKPVVCWLRPSWVEQVRRQVPGYIEELPVVSASEDTVEDVVRELASDAGMRRDLGERGRSFALKWHSAAAGARRMDDLYKRLLDDEPIPDAPVEPPQFAVEDRQPTRI